jgi:Septum formation initiator
MLLVQNDERVVKMKKSGLKEKTSVAGRTKAKAPASRAKKKVDNGRRLHVVEGGRQVTEPRHKRVSGQPAHQKHRIPPAIRRRRRLAACILVLLAAGLITYVLLGPILGYVRSNRNLSKTEAQLAEEKAQTQELQDKKDFESTDKYAEGKARESGYVKLGEIPIIVLDEQQPEQNSDQGNQATSSDSNSQAPPDQSP